VINHLLNLHFSAPSVRKYSATNNQQMGDVYQLFLDLILDLDKYKLPLEFDKVFMTKLFE